jgi:hypothetical protein
METLIEFFDKETGKHLIDVNHNQYEPCCGYEIDGWTMEEMPTVKLFTKQTTDLRLGTIYARVTIKKHIK